MSHFFGGSTWLLVKISSLTFTREIPLCNEIISLCELKEFYVWYFVEHEPFKSNEVFVKEVN